MCSLSLHLFEKGFFYARAPVLLNDPLKSFTIWSILDFCCKILQYMYYKMYYKMYYIFTL